MGEEEGEEGVDRDGVTVPDIFSTFDSHCLFAYRSQLFFTRYLSITYPITCKFS